ncbi:MAG: AAA family ATPase [Candidatus Heimdallarchaeota archaeon]|nr:AAA family ATPase [Candidatus Heimdallarchaeota archaeon]MDH5646949.1 AAA family ATPase [Candidatus Heimdallarchaeota archaeon]
MILEIIVITGSVCTGKSTIANALGEEGYIVYNIFDIAKTLDCVSDYNSKYDAFMVDDTLLKNRIPSFLNELQGLVIIEGHYTNVLPSNLVKICFVLRASLRDLRERLILRGYSNKKIRENLAAETMDVCLSDSINQFSAKKVIEIRDKTIHETIDYILSYLK